MYELPSKLGAPDIPNMYKNQGQQYEQYDQQRNDHD